MVRNTRECKWPSNHSFDAELREYFSTLFLKKKICTTATGLEHAIPWSESLLVSFQPSGLDGRNWWNYRLYHTSYCLGESKEPLTCIWQVIGQGRTNVWEWKRLSFILSIFLAIIYLLILPNNYKWWYNSNHSAYKCVNLLSDLSMKNRTTRLRLVVLFFIERSLRRLTTTYTPRSSIFFVLSGGYFS